MSNFPFSPPLPGIIDNESTHSMFDPEFSYNSSVKNFPSFLILTLGSTAAILCKSFYKISIPAHNPEPNPAP